MPTPVQHGPPPPGWDDAVRNQGAHILQSRAWALFQSQLGHRTVHARDDGWSWSAVVLRGHGLTQLYAPYGPTLDDALALPAAIASLREAAVEANATFIRVEPRGPLNAAQMTGIGAHPSRELQPQHTSVVDLAPEPVVLEHNLAKGHRYSLKQSLKRGVTIRRSEDPADATAFLRLLAVTANRRAFHPFPDSYYRTQLEVLAPLGHARLYLAEHEGGAVAGAIGFCGWPTHYYTHAAADQERSRRLRATPPLVWRMILDARQDGARAFDLWGVAPITEPDHAWAGFSEYKRQFGGHDVSTVGTWDLPVRRLAHLAYRVARRVR